LCKEELDIFIREWLVLFQLLLHQVLEIFFSSVFSDDAEPLFIVKFFYIFNNERMIDASEDLQFFFYTDFFELSHLVLRYFEDFGSEYLIVFFPPYFVNFSKLAIAKLV